MALYLGKDKIAGHSIDSKIGDTLPVGAIIDYDGTEVPANWELVEGEEQLGVNTILLKISDTQAEKYKKLKSAVDVESLDTETGKFTILAPILYEYYYDYMYYYLELIPTTYDSTLQLWGFTPRYSTGSRYCTGGTIRANDQTQTVDYEQVFDFESAVTLDDIPNQEIEFNIGDTIYRASRGMSWEEWLNSDYNINGFMSSDNMVLTNNYYGIYVTEGSDKVQIYTHNIIAGSIIYTAGTSPIPV